jgi:DNA polymerase alpha subunit B
MFSPVSTQKTTAGPATSQQPRSQPSAAPSSVTPAVTAARVPVIETFSGLQGNLTDPQQSLPPSRPSLETLNALGFRPGLLEGDITADVNCFGSDLGRARPAAVTPGAKAALREAAAKAGWPLLYPSIELYGAVVGWRIDSRSSSMSTSSDNAAAAEQAAGETLVRVFDRNVYEPYRYMFSPLNERSEALGDRLDELAKLIMNNSTSSVSSSMARAMSVGRVCLDGEIGRLNASSVALELKRVGKIGGSERMVLDLREVPSFGIFPGQIIGVRGATMGSKLIVTEAVTNACLPRIKIPLKNAKALYQARQKGGPTRVWVACGPYTNNSNLSYESLQSFLAEASQAKNPPNVIIMMGPFIDADHPMCKSGETTYDGHPISFSFLWETLFLQLFSVYLSEPSLSKCEVVIMNSTTDVNADPVFPQWSPSREMFDSLDSSLRERITVLSNPATFVVADLIFGATSADILFHLNLEDCVKHAPGTTMPDRFTYLSRYLLEQSSYYPLYPAGGAPHTGVTMTAAAQELANAQYLPLEATMISHTAMSVRPDVLLLPSKVGKPCVRPITPGLTGATSDSTIVVNPGFISKGKSDGSFAKITIFVGDEPKSKSSTAVDENDLEEEDDRHWVQSAAADRVLVEILNL